MGLVTTATTNMVHDKRHFDFPMKHYHHLSEVFRLRNLMGIRVAGPELRRLRFVAAVADAQESDIVEQFKSVFSSR